MRWIVLLAFCLVLTGSAQAAGSDEQYLDVYNEILQADSLQQSGHSDAAVLRYLQAQGDLRKLHFEHPSWNPDIVQYRLDYLTAKLQELEKFLPATNAPPVAPKVIAPVSVEPSVAALEQQNAGLREQVRSLTSANVELQGKLKEALSVQPAAVSPAELAKAQARIVALQKERDLLAVALEQEKTANASALSEARAAAAEQAAADHKARAAVGVQKSEAEWAEAREAAADASRKLAAANQELEVLKAARAEEAERDAAFRLRAAADEKKAEEEMARLKEAAAGRPGEVRIAEGAKPIADEGDRLKQLLATIAKDEAAITQLKTDAADTEKKLAAANSELDALKTAHPAEAPSADTKAIQQERDQLKEELAQRSKDLADAEAHHNQELLTVRASLQEAELRRDALEKKLAAASTVSTESPAKEPAATAPAPAENPEVARRMETLQARIAVLEADPVPYTPEELALLKKTPPPALANSPQAAAAPTTNAAPHPGHVYSSKDLPAGSGALWEEALRAWRGGDFPKAEEKYKDVLRQDPANVYVLVFLANVQFAAGHLAECEKSLQTALSVDPDDAGCLYLLGLMRYRQNRPDEALDALSLSAKYNPTNAATQNFLGCVLADKGMRNAAETALRKSLETDPDYADAHFNLAVVYAGNKPPSLELARWHYRKALALGHAKSESLDKLLSPPAP